MSEEAFVSNQKVKLKNGEEVVLPPLTLKKILLVTKSVSVFVDEVKKHLPNLVQDIDSLGDTSTSSTHTLSIGAKIIESLPSILPVVIEQLIDVIATYLGKEKEWVLDNMDMEDLVNVAGPFFLVILSQGNILAAGVNKALTSLNPPK